MATTLTLTPQPDTASVLVQITGAPVLPAPVYSSTLDYVTGPPDGWIPGADGAQAAPDSSVVSDGYNNRAGTTVGALQLYSGDLTGLYDYGRAQRTVTGLTVGKVYRFTCWATSPYGVAKVRAAVAGIGYGAWVQLANNDGAWHQVVYTFTATATSHTIALDATDVPGTFGEGAATVVMDDPDVTEQVSGWRDLTLTRTDDNGTHAVRLLPGQQPVGGSMTVTDYEPALTGLVRYDVLDQQSVAVTASTTLAGAVEYPQLTPATRPQYQQQVTSVLTLTGPRDTTTVVHDVIGSTAPAITLGRLRTRAGTLEVWCADYATARAVESLFDLGLVVMLRQPTFAGMDLYLTATRVEPAALEVAGRWVVRVDYRETTYPAGDLAGALGWTFDDVVGDYASFTEVAASFATFADLVAGP